MSVLTLKRVLIADAITGALMFVVCVFDGALVAPLLGLPLAVVLAAGWICLPSAMLFAFVAMQAQPSQALLRVIVLGNFAWVAASLAVVMACAGTMTMLGLVITIVQAMCVLGFGLLESRGAKALATA